MAIQHKNGKDGKRRGNHTGTLIKRGKTYLAQWSVRGPDGKRKRISKSTHCKNIEDARAFLENELKSLTLDDEEKFVDRLLDAKKLINVERQEIAETYLHNSSILTHRIKKAFTRAGIKTTAKCKDGKNARVDVGFHSLRHTFVSLSANAGVPLTVVQAIVGHTNPVMTRHYFHASDDALKGAVAALPDVIDVSDKARPSPSPAKTDKLSAIRSEIPSLADAELVELTQFVNAEIKRRG